MTEHLSDLLERLADDAPSMRAGLVADSVRRGTRIRRNRAALRMAGSATMVAAVVLAATALTHQSPENADQVPPAATTSKEPTRDIPIAQAVGELFAPHGEISQPETFLQLDSAGLTAVLTDASGNSAGIAVTDTTYQGQAFPSATSGDGRPPTSCAQVDGSDYQGFRCQEVDRALVVSYRVGSFTGARDQGAYANVVEVRHRDGLITIVRSYNSIGEKSGGPMLDKPLLDPAQLQAIALDPLWRQVQLGTE